MGVKFGREYPDIIKDLSDAIAQIEEIYEFLEMPEEDWVAISTQDREQILQTVSDDIFYALGNDATQKIGSGIIQHDGGNHVIKVSNGDNLITVVYLV